MIWLGGVRLGVPLHPEHEGVDSGSSIASGRSSPVERPVTTRPSPSTSIALMVVGLGHRLLGCRRPARRASRARAGRRARCRRRCRCCGGDSSCCRTSGRCWISVPPRATLSTCIPRQMHSVGMSRSIARVEQRELELVARRDQSDGRRMLLLAVADGVDVGSRRRAPARRSGRGPHRGSRPAPDPAAASAPSRRRAGSTRCRRTAAARRAPPCHIP